MWFWFFVFSFLINILSVFYVRCLLKSLAIINEDDASANEIILNFTLHTKSIYEMEMVYGDETLKAFIDHATEVSKRLEDLDLLLDETGDSSDKEEEKKEN